MPDQTTPPIDPAEGRSQSLPKELLASARQMARSDLELSLLLYNRTVLSAGGFPLEPQTTVSDALREDLRKARSDLLHAMAIEQALTDWLNRY